MPEKKSSHIILPAVSREGRTNTGKSTIVLPEGSRVRAIRLFGKSRPNHTKYVQLGGAMRRFPRGRAVANTSAFGWCYGHFYIHRLRYTVTMVVGNYSTSYTRTFQGKVEYSQ
jgi:hypothetical protein